MNHYAKREEEKPLFVRIMYWCICVVLLLMFLLLFWVPMNAQERSNTYYVSQFQGADVGAKTTNAQAACSPNASLPCIIVFDAILAAWPQGTMPARCAQCTWMDYRLVNGPQISPISFLTMVQDVDPPGVAGSDILYASSVGNQWRMKNNGGSADNLVGVNLAANLANKTLTQPFSGNNVTLITPCSSDNAGTITGNGTSQNIFSCTLPANTLGPGKSIEFVYTALQGGSTAGTPIFTFGNQSLIPSSCTPGTQILVWTVTVKNKAGVTNAQTLSMSGSCGVTLANATPVTNSAVDTTAGVVVSVSFSNANTVTFTPSQAIAMLIQ